MPIGLKVLAYMARSGDPAQRTATTGMFDQRFRGFCMGISVFEMSIASYGYFSKSYAEPSPGIPPANHLGMDFTQPAGTEIVSHVDGDWLGSKTESSGWKTYCAVWNGAYTHIFGHVEPKRPSSGKVKVGDVIGVVKKLSDGGVPHLHYGVNIIRSLSFDREDKVGKWGWGRCPLKATKSMAAQYGWVDPRMVLMSMALAQGRSYKVALKYN